MVVVSGDGFIADNLARACAQPVYIPVRARTGLWRWCSSTSTGTGARPPGAILNLAKFSTSRSARRPYGHTVHLFISDKWSLAQKCSLKEIFPSGYLDINR